MSASIRPTTSAPRRLLLLLLLHVQLDNLVALMPAPFGVTTPRAAQQATAPRRRRSTLRSTWPRCCICINCKFVDRCKVYHWVETMHEQPHVTEEQKLDFDPSDPQVQVFLRSEEEAASAEGSRPLLTTEYDVFECDAFTPDMGRWVRLMPEADFIPT